MRRTEFMLTGILLISAIAGIPRASFAQTDPRIGTWQLNLAKSKFSGPPPKSATMYIRGQGQNTRNTTVEIDGEGNAVAMLFEDVTDGRPHPVTILLGTYPADMATFTRVDANTVNISVTKAGKIVSMITEVVSQDGKTLTLTTTVANAIGQLTGITVFDKQ